MPSSIKTRISLYASALAACLCVLMLLVGLWLSGMGSQASEAATLVWGLGLGLAGVVAAAALAFRASRRLVRRIEALTTGADHIAHGDYSAPLRQAQQDELGRLEYTVEQMRQRLALTTVSRDELQGVLDSMTDAVFVTTTDGEIRIANHAAAQLTGRDGEALRGSALRDLFEGLPPAAQTDILKLAGETVLRSSTGQTIPVSLSASQLAQSRPEFSGCVFVARDITERKRAERRIRYLARYDALTKIPNRMQFQHLLQQAIARSLRNRSAVGMLYLDMDRFKEVNDTFGHAAGDRVLEILIERLTRILPSGAVMGRLAGDEFALFAEGLTPVEARSTLRQLSAAILEAVAKPFHINQQEIFLTVSIGAAFCPRDAENVIDLIRNADAAMYYSKEGGGNSYVSYSPEMNAAAVERLMLKSKLKRAVERDELVLRYMPKVEIASGRIVGAEGLLRWRLPGHGDIPPSQFIPLAEENDLILTVGEWVLNQICRDYRAIAEHVHDPGRISLNLSLRQLRQASFILRCRSVFENHQVSPANLELEITESTLMTDPRRTIPILQELRELGLHLSIDDFGTGYSSLAVLQQFPIGTLKIDQSFVRDALEQPGVGTLVRTIIEMARNLGMQVVAEGVETEAQLAFLKDLNCHYAQGRLFGEPCTAAALAEQMWAQEHGVAPFGEVFAVEPDAALPASTD
jgi:diguanylate cyclase (GGDEF)-like protein/PAS domain S-box-containing protein